MQKIKNRSEIPEELKWDLTTIYKTDEDFYKDIEEQIKENPQEEEIKVGFEKTTQEQGEIENESPTQTIVYI